MPLAHMRSMGPLVAALRLAAENKSLRLEPDQKLRSNSSFCFFTLFRANSLRKMAAQLAIDTVSSSLFSTTAPAGGVYTRVGALGASSLNVFGFDISGAGVAYAGLTGDDSYSSLYTINLQTGAATLVGAFGVQGNTALPTIVGLTVAPAVPEPTSLGLLLAGLGAVGFALRRAHRG